MSVRVVIDAARLAAAPVSWGVSEVPRWGHQLAPARVVAEMRSAGFTATEAGPPGWLPEGCPLELVAGFLAAEDVQEVARQAAWLAAHGAAVLCFAAGRAEAGYDDATTSEGGGPGTWAAVAEAEEVCSRHGLRLAVHPHFGTRIETAADVDALLAQTRSDVCLDTGHLRLGGADPARIPADRVALVHLKDLDASLAERVRTRELPFHDAVRHGLFRALGEGDADIGGLVARLEAHGYRGTYVLEQDCVLAGDPAPGTGPAEDARRSLAFVRTLPLPEAG
jgi:inosose dehydratase